MLTLIPAYHRDYKNQKEVKAAWSEGKDFQICDMFHKDHGRVMNKEDLDRSDITSVCIRFKQLRNICVIKRVR